jgi:hypothetical protein
MRVGHAFDRVAILQISGGRAAPSAPPRARPRRSPAFAKPVENALGPRRPAETGMPLRLSLLVSYGARRWSHGKREHAPAAVLMRAALRSKREPRVLLGLCGEVGRGSRPFPNFDGANESRTPNVVRRRDPPPRPAPTKRAGSPMAIADSTSMQKRLRPPGGWRRCCGRKDSARRRRRANRRRKRWRPLARAGARFAARRRHRPLFVSCAPRSCVSPA